MLLLAQLLCAALHLDAPLAEALGALLDLGSRALGGAGARLRVPRPLGLAQLLERRGLDDVREDERRIDGDIGARRRPRGAARHAVEAGVRVALRRSRRGRRGFVLLGRRCRRALASGAARLVVVEDVLLLGAV